MKIKNQKGYFFIEITVLFIAIITVGLVLILEKSIKSREMNEKEVKSLEELILKHHESKVGHFVISSYEECVKKNNQLTDPRLIKAECIQLALNNARSLESPELTAEGIQHLQEYLQESEDYLKKLPSKE